MHRRTQPAPGARPTKRAPPPRTAPGQSRATRRAAARGAALGLVLVGVHDARKAAAGVHPGETDVTALAAAFAAAWAARDLEAVVALFADDAVVRQRGAEIAVEDAIYGPSVAVRDAFGVGVDYLGDPPPRDPHDPRAVVWAAGRPQIRAWARRLFASGQAATVYAHGAGAVEAADPTVRWAYRATAEPYQRLPGVGPTAGTVEIAGRAGRIVSVTIEPDADSVRARDVAIARALGVSAAPPPGTGRRTSADDAWGIPIGLVLTGVLTRVLRKRLGGAHRRS